MVIISKHKDFYDYLVSYYGRDDLIVYDRRNPVDWLRPCINEANQYLFSVCGVFIPVVKRDRFVFCHTDQQLKTNPHTPSGRYYSNNGAWNSDKWFLQKWENKKSDLNVKYRQPVLYVRNPNTSYEKVGIPILQEFGFASQFEHHEMYQKIYAFLSWLKDNPEPLDNQSDKDKIVAHGFDLKDSFRPKAKLRA